MALLNVTMNASVKGDLVRILTLASEIGLDQSVPRTRRICKPKADVYAVADLAARHCFRVSTVYAGLREKSSLLACPLRPDPWSIQSKFLFSAQAIRRCEKTRAAFYAGVREEDPELSQADWKASFNLLGNVWSGGA